MASDDDPASPAPARRAQSPAPSSVVIPASTSIDETALYATGPDDRSSLSPPRPAWTGTASSSGASTHISVNPPGSSTTTSGSGSGPGRGGLGSRVSLSDLFEGAHYPADMTSSVQQHVYEGGLRYHAYRDGKYAFPNDEVEQNRDDMKHAMTLMLMGGEHCYAPVEERLREGGEVLDLGTGTGIWVIEMADKFPNTTFRGVDLSPIQPNYVPDNVYFVVDDFEDDWVHPDSSIDYIHVRHTLHSVRDRRALLQRCLRHLKPGGYVEFQELRYEPRCDDGSAGPEVPYAFRDFMGFMDAGLRALGSELNAITSLADEMRGAGFEAVEERRHKCPIGVWPRDKRLRYCGLFLRTAIMDGLRGLVRRPLGTGLGWTQLQIEVFLVDVRKAVMDPDFHTYFPFHVVYARKPMG